MSEKKSGKTYSIFYRIMMPLLLLLLLETGMLALILAGSDVLRQLNRNSENILQKQVQNRAGYLNSSVMRLTDLSFLAETINQKTQELLDQGELDLELLDQNSDACAPLVLDIVEDLVTVLYSKRLTGIYVIFNTQDLSQISDWRDIPNKTGIYIRDMDPTAMPAVRNSDLLLERAPIAVVRSMNISTDKGWRPLFHFSNDETGENIRYFTEPVRAVFAAQNRSDAEQFGYWSAPAMTLQNVESAACTYSIPLILQDGTVYGVLGIDFMEEYLESMLPYKELEENEEGRYFLSTGEARADSLELATPMIGYGKTKLMKEERNAILLTSFRDGYRFRDKDGTDWFAAAEDILLYGGNSPFEKERWVLMGAVPVDSLYAFSRRLVMFLELDLILMLIIGICGSIGISRRMTMPIRKLSRQVEQSRTESGIPHLSVTGIKEIDRFASEITSLSRDVVNASTRFLQIIQLASVELGGFELRFDDKTVYVTDNFFPMLGIESVDPKALTIDKFGEVMAFLKEQHMFLSEEDGSILYKIEPPSEPVRYIRVNVTNLKLRQVGVAEDVTFATQERLRIKHERDYDLLTGLLNRRAFYAQAEALFANPAKLGFAAVMMLDLDNLKYINDHYGHDSGDKYICRAGMHFAESAPSTALCSRVSGDEFFILFYGYTEREELQRVIGRFAAAISRNEFVMPSGERLNISASGGVSWYPEDSTDFHQLMKYADFAMYQVKHGQKGSMGEFDLGMYNQENFRMSARQEFYQLLREERIFYHFQPIVDARTGRVRAYEALMRTDLPTIHSPAMILKIAREEKRLQDIENLTWIKAPAGFLELLEKKLANPDALLFINSIADQAMTDGTQKQYCREFHALQSRIVTEITESEDLESGILAVKRGICGDSGLYALDDYGSGYNSERILLELSPRFIKVDIAIIRDIDTNPDKQQIVSNIVGYAHERGMEIVAEGIETIAELEKVLELDVDLLQGYLLARPAAVPYTVSEQVLEVIHEYRQRSCCEDGKCPGRTV